MMDYIDISILIWYGELILLADETKVGIPEFILTKCLI